MRQGQKGALSLQPEGVRMPRSRVIVQNHCNENPGKIMTDRKEEEPEEPQDNWGSELFSPPHPHYSSRILLQYNEVQAPELTNV